MAKNRVKRLKKSTPTASASSRNKRKQVIVIGLLLCLVISGVGFAQWHTHNNSTRGNTMLHVMPALMQQSEQSSSTFSPSSPAKEYIYAGGRLIATEEPPPTPAPTPTPPPSCTPSGTPNVFISEFRLYGPNGATDEFIELYNNSDTAVTVCAPDGTNGWTISIGQATGQTAQTSVDDPYTALLVDSGPDAVGTKPPPPTLTTSLLIPNGTSISARGHYLLTDAGSKLGGGGYSLGSYATGDKTYTGDIVSGAGLALFNTADSAHFTSTYLLDAVGFSGVDTLHYEGTALSPAGGNVTAGQYSWVRKLTSGYPQDTNNNASDFAFVSTNGGTYDGVASTLGAPGPESTQSPIQRNLSIPASVVDPGSSSTSGVNRVRDTTPNVCNGGTAPSNCTLGTLTIRRKFTNNTGQKVTRLRFRVVSITTYPTTTTADMRVVNSPDTTVQLVSGDQVPVLGTTVEGPTQSMGGGLNSTVTVNLGKGLGTGASVNVQFVLGLMQGGAFSFTVNTEALP